MHLDHGLDERQTQPGAFRDAGARVVRLTKGFHDLRNVLGGDADTRVADRQPQRAAAVERPAKPSC